MRSAIRVLCLLAAMGSNAIAATPTRLTIFVPGALERPVRQLAGGLEAATGVRTHLIVRKSRTMYRDIRAGTACDVFISANDDVLAAGVTDGVWPRPEPLAEDPLVLFTAARSRSVSGTVYIAKPDVTVGLLASRMLPALDKSARVTRIDGNGQSVCRAVLRAPGSRGIAYESDLCAVGRGAFRPVEPPARAAPRASFRIAVPASSASAALARRFVALCLSERGRAAFREHCVSAVRQAGPIYRRR